MEDQGKREWPLALEAHDGAFVILCKFYASIPYGGVEQPGAKQILELQEFARPMSEYIPDAQQLLASGDEWNLLGKISLSSRELDQGSRDAIALEVVLGDDLIPEDREYDTALLIRRYDVALEALGSTFTSAALIEAVQSHAEWIADNARAPIMAVLTSSDVVEFAEMVHNSQSAFTGIYIPGAADALRWGQRKLDGVSDEDLILSIAEDVARLRQRERMGDISNIRRYGEMLSEDIRAMSTSRAHGATPDERAKQLRVFTTLLSVVSECLGEDDDGLATEEAPNFEGMRLSEVHELAEAMSITIEEIDGHRESDEATGRGIWNASNWYVRAQAPSPGQSVGHRRRVRIWVLRHHEHALSPHEDEHWTRAIAK